MGRDVGGSTRFVRPEPWLLLAAVLVAISIVVGAVRRRAASRPPSGPEVSAPVRPSGP